MPTQDTQALLDSLPDQMDTQEEFLQISKVVLQVVFDVKFSDSPDDEEQILLVHYNKTTGTFDMKDIYTSDESLVLSMDTNKLCEFLLHAAVTAKAAIPACMSEFLEEQKSKDGGGK